jgi:hypothetical protein
MKKIILAAVLVASATNVLAEGAFDGPYVQLGVGMVSNTTKADLGLAGEIISPNDLSLISSDLSNDGAMGQILVGYSRNVSGKFNLAANAFYNFGNNKSGTLSVVEGVARLDAKLKNVWGISIEPGFYFSDNTLGYVKLGYQEGDIKLNGNLDTSNIDLPVPDLTGYANTKSKGGAFLYGFGIKHLLTPNIYIGADVTRADYSNERLSGSFGSGDFNAPIPSELLINSKATQTSGLVTLGYKF